MPLGIGAAILGGSVASGLFGARQADKSMNFQRRAARSAHQWEVEDLRRAGLNPILSGTGGPGAKPAGGAMPTTPDIASSAQSALRIKEEINLIKEQARGVGNQADISAVKAAIARALLAAGRNIGLGDTSTAKGVLGNIESLNQGIGATTPKMQAIIDKAKRGKQRDVHRGHTHLHMNIKGKRR